MRPVTVTGDLLESPMRIIGHQVSMAGVMGAGIALQIRRKWPEVYTDYMRGVKDGSLVLGGILTTDVRDPAVPGEVRTVVSLAGQIGVGRLHRQTVYDALRAAMRKTFALAMRLQVDVGLPYGIGCGLAGGDWSIVERIIADEFGAACVLYVK